jgi:hypothetical protein
MPVQKFRSVADMPDPPRRLPGDPALYKAIAGVWKFGRRANPRRFPPGVYKYRSIEEMSRAQEQWLSEHVQALARQRRDR